MNKLLISSRYFFGLFGNSFNEGLIRSSIHSPLSCQSKTFTPQPAQYNVTKLENGITVLTQSVTVPSTVHLGIFVDVGTRDQTSDTSGVMLSLKNTYLKTAINTSQTVNYGITQMSGGQFEMDYNRQNSYYNASCLSHDVLDVFSMVADSAFEPKNFVSTSVGMYKNANSHKLQTFLGGNQVFTDNIFQAAYGRQGLGMPLLGLRSNVNYLNAHTVQKFQASHITPKRVIISASGIESHDQFVDLVKQKLSTSILSQKLSERSAQQYVGGQVRNLTQANNIHIVLAFQGANHQNALPLAVAEEILGAHRRLGRIQKNLKKNVFIDGAQTLNANYTDTGLFGLKVSGSASHAKQILNATAKQLNGLKQVTPAQVELAKQSLKGKINRTLSCNAKRLEQRTKALYYTGKTNEHFLSQIDGVTADQVTSAVRQSLSTHLTFVSRGGEVNTLPSYDSVSALFK